MRKNTLITAAIATIIATAAYSSPSTGLQEEEGSATRDGEANMGARVSNAIRAVDLPAGTLADALNQLAKQTGVDLVYRPDQVVGFKTPAIRGELTTTDAINKLLQGTPLRLST